MPIIIIFKSGNLIGHCVLFLLASVQILQLYDCRIAWPHRALRLML